MARDEQMVTDPLARSGAVLGIVVGLGLIGYGVYSFVPPASAKPFSIALLIAGLVESLMCYFTLYRSRASWSFALSLSGVAAAVFLFGATQIRDATGLHLAVSLIPSVAFGATTALLSIASDEFKGT